MIDIHCHILPGVDDGPKNIEESIEMARIAYKEGIRTIVSTSHYKLGNNYIVEDKLLEKLENFNKALKENNIEVRVLIGNEIYYTENTLKELENKKIYTINNSRYILIEFSTILLPRNLNSIISELNKEGYTPILAHIERYREVQNNYKIVESAINEGALIQVNASSILKKSPRVINKITKKLIKKKLVHFIGTDAHSSKRRKPTVKESYDYICKKYGKHFGDRLYVINPMNVINNRDIEVAYINPQHNENIISKLFKVKNNP